MITLDEINYKNILIGGKFVTLVLLGFVKTVLNSVWTNLFSYGLISYKRYELRYFDGIRPVVLIINI